MNKIIILIFISAFTFNISAQKNKTVDILTSAECVQDCCKERIEEEMKFTRGVTAANLDIESKILTITFKTKKTDIDEIRSVISLIGYNADDVIADKEAHQKLPTCCQHIDFIDPDN